MKVLISGGGIALAAVGRAIEPGPVSCLYSSK
jgi:hypothetical protein